MSTAQKHNGQDFEHNRPGPNKGVGGREAGRGGGGVARSTGANVSVMVLQGRKSTLQKSRPIESGHGRHAVQVARLVFAWTVTFIKY